MAYLVVNKQPDSFQFLVAASRFAMTDMENLLGRSIGPKGYGEI